MSNDKTATLASCCNLCNQPLADHPAADRCPTLTRTVDIVDIDSAVADATGSYVDIVIADGPNGPVATLTGPGNVVYALCFAWGYDYADLD